MSATFVNSIRSGLAMAKQMRGDNTHPINCIYIEYENVASPGDTVAVPTASTTEGLEYYNSLSSDRDFIRASILGTPELSVSSGSGAYFGDGEGNTLTFVAITAEAAGELGRTFDNASNSKVYGLALVSAPDWSDRSKDILIQRAYYSAEPDQVVRPAGGSFAARYPITFGV